MSRRLPKFTNSILPLLLLAGTPNLAQNGQGDCNVAIGRATGNSNRIRVSCPGIPRRALRRIEARLAFLQNRERRIGAANAAQDRRIGNLEAALRQRDELLRTAHDWARRYRELQSEVDRLPGRDKLTAEVKRMLAAGDLDGAGEILDRLLRGQKQEVATAARYNYLLGKVYDLQFKMPEAAAHYEKAYRYDPKNVTHGIHFAQVLLRLGRFKKTIKVSENIRGPARRQSKKEPQRFRSLYAGLLSNLGSAYTDTDRLDDAEDALEEAWKVNRRIEAPGRLDWLETAGIHLRLALLYFHTGRFKTMQERIDLAREDLTALAGQDPTFQTQLAMIISLQGALFIKRERWREAHTEYLRSEEILRKRARTEPALSGYVLLVLLSMLGEVESKLALNAPAEQHLNEAIAGLRRGERKNPARRKALVDAIFTRGVLYSRMGRLAAAEKDLSTAMELMGRLAIRNPDAHAGQIAFIRFNQGILDQKNGRTLAARAKLTEAVQTFRRLARENPGVYHPKLAAALVELGVTYYDQRNLPETEKRYDEALGLYEDLADDNEELYDPEVMKTRRMLAGVYLFSGRRGKARSAYNAVLRQAQRLAREKPDVYESYLAETTGIFANYFAMTGDFKEALARNADAIALYEKLLPKNPMHGDDLSKLLVLRGLMFNEIRGGDPCAAFQRAVREARSKPQRERAARERDRFCR